MKCACTSRFVWTRLWSLKPELMFGLILALGGTSRSLTSVIERVQSLAMRKASVYLGKTTFRRRGRPVGMLQNDRFLHMLILGQTGTGKTTLMRNLAMQDAATGRGFLLLDPHGDLAEELHVNFENNGITHQYIDLGSEEPGFSYNPLADVKSTTESFVVNSLVDVFQHIWALEDAPRFEHLLRNVLFALLAWEEPSLHLIPRLLADRSFRRRVVAKVENDEVRRFWEGEFEGYSAKFRAVVVAPLQNKIGALLTDPRLNKILSSRDLPLDLRKEMDTEGIVIANLAKGRVGAGPSSLIGSLLLTEVARLGFTRADIPESERRDFIVYADEFHAFTTESVASMLSELRKYRIGLAASAQFTSQMRRDVRDAVFGNAGTKIVFRVGPQDARLLAVEFGPKLGALDLMASANWTGHMRLMIEGQPSKPFSFRTDAPLAFKGIAGDHNDDQLFGGACRSLLSNRLGKRGYGKT